MVLQIARKPIELQMRPRLQSRLAGIEQHIAQSDHHALVGLLRPKLLFLQLSVLLPLARELLLRRLRLHSRLLRLILRGLHLLLGTLRLLLRRHCLVLLRLEQQLLPLLGRLRDLRLRARGIDARLPRLRMPQRQVRQLVHLVHRLAVAQCILAAAQFRPRRLEVGLGGLGSLRLARQRFDGVARPGELRTVPRSRGAAGEERSRRSDRQKATDAISHGDLLYGRSRPGPVAPGPVSPDGAGLCCNCCFSVSMLRRTWSADCWALPLAARAPARSASAAALSANRSALSLLPSDSAVFAALSSSRACCKSAAA